MWNTDTFWFDIAVVSGLFVLGHIGFGHFEERTSAWRKLAKYVFTLCVVTCLSALFGRIVSFGLLGVMLLGVFYIHGIWLPRKGINGWTGEPKARYYELRGWSRDIFGDEDA